jgi:hypothetical protein
VAEFEKSIAHEAHGLVHGERAKTYGHPRFDFSAIAKVWTGLLQDLLKEDAQLDAYRISVLMSGLKLCRLVKSPKHRDSRVDTIGYMLTMERLDEPEVVPADEAARTEGKPVEWDKVKKVTYPAPLGKYNVADIQLMEGFAQEELARADAAAVEDDDIADDDYDVHGRPVDYDDHGRPLEYDMAEEQRKPIAERAWNRANQQIFSQINIWFEPGETKIINDEAHTNTDNTGKTICFPFLPGTTVKIGKPASNGYDQSLPWQPPGQHQEKDGDRWVKDPSGRFWERDDIAGTWHRLTSTAPPDDWYEVKCPAHGKETCEACSQPGELSRCCCGYFESTGMHWDTCPARIRSFPEHLPRTPETKIHEVHGGDKDCWCGHKAVNPERLVEAKPKNIHNHQVQEPCMPGCPAFDLARDKNAQIITELFQAPPFEFTGEQVEIERENPVARAMRGLRLDGS